MALYAAMLGILHGGFSFSEEAVYLCLHRLPSSLRGLKIARTKRPLHFTTADDRAQTKRDFTAVLPHTTTLHESVHPDEHSVCIVLCTSWSGTKDRNAVLLRS